MVLRRQITFLNSARIHTGGGNMLVQAKCPGCKASLSIPSQWLHQPIRCKHCGMIVQLKQPPVAGVPQRPAVVPMARPAAPAPAPVAVAKPSGVPMGLVPSALVLARLSTCAPMAERIPSYAVRTNPRRRTTFAQKLTAAAVWLTVLGLLSAGGYVGVTQYLPEWEDGATPVATVDPNADLAKVDTPAPEPVKEEKKEPRKEEKVPVVEKTPPVKPVESMKDKSGKDKTTKPIEKTPIRPPVKPIEKTPIRPPVRPPIRPPVRPIENPTNPNPNNPNPIGNPNTPRPDPVGFGTFPRRMLAINVSNYLYFNPVSYGPKTRDTHVMLDRMSRALAIPPSELFELSDGARATSPSPR